MLAKRTYRGRLNLDDSRYMLPKEDYSGARNISKGSNVPGNDGSPSGTVSNRLVAYTKPSGTSKTIGAYADLYRNRIIDFNHNSDGKHFIRIFDAATRTFTKLLESKTDTGGVDILTFQAQKKITNVSIIHRDPAEGDLLFWTDGVNPPRKLNIDRVLSGSYGVVEADFISAAKKMPLVPPMVAYADDFARNTNNLRKKLYQLKYRWVYDDFEKSAWSRISDVPLPADIVNNDNDLNPSRNNNISVKVKTGNKDVTKIEIAARVSLGSTWGDFVLVDSLNKDDLAIADNSEYDYKFYNDSLYPPIDINESNLYFDWFPRYAEAQALVNGNVVVYGAITEGYDPLPVTDLDVTMTVANVRNIGVDSGPAALSYVITVPGVSTTVWRFTVTGRVPTGTVYTVTARLNTGTIFTLCTYTSASGNTTTNVAAGLYGSVNVAYQDNYFASNYFDIHMPTGSSILNVQVVEGAGGTELATSSTWNWNSKYRFGLVYFDDQGRTNGVMTFVDQTATADDFEVNTGNIEIDSNTPKTPVITAAINHTPPSWATRYCWVRTENLTYQDFKYYVTCDFQSDADYYYFGLQNIKYFYDLNNKFIYNELSVAEGDRIKVMCNVAAGVYGSNIYTQDFEIMGVVEKQLTGGTASDKGMFVKVKKPGTAPSPAYVANMLVMLYTPKVSSTDADLNVYYEFGATYDIYTSGSNRYHKGMTQDQDGSNPAEFEFATGDMYYHQRTMYTSILAASPTKTTLFVIDRNYNEFFKSSVNGNGRPVAVDPDAREQYYPATVRFSQEYVQDTNINGVNRFYFDNQDTYNRSFGDIRRLVERDRQMRVYQKLKCGVVPVFQQVIKDAVNGDVLAQSDRLLNKIQYYSGEFGIGDNPESLASEEYADYFTDNIRGRICRLSRDGITPISVLYKVDSWAVDNLPQRGSAAKMYGCYDRMFNRYVLAIEASGPSPAETISFYEPENAFEGFHDMQPEFMVCIGTLFCSYKNGDLWTHDGTTYCNFYGVQYKPEISAVYNEGVDFKKTFDSAGYVSGTQWECPTITTSLGQLSNLKVGDFRKREDGYYAPLLRDSNSPGGVNRGDKLKGNWIDVLFRAVDGSVYNSLVITRVSFKESNKNT